MPLNRVAEVWRAADVLCASWARDQLRLYQLTALRHSLIAELHFSEVDAKARVLRISPHKKGTKLRGADTAANAPEIVLPISATALAIIEACRPLAPDPSGPVWYSVSQPGGATAKTGARDVPRYSDPRSNWSHIEERVLGGTHFMRHDLRRTFANIAVDAQADMMGTSLLLMHSPRTLAGTLGLPDITVAYMNTAGAQRQMRSAAESIERYILGLLDATVVPSSVDPELPHQLAVSVGNAAAND